LADFKEKIIIWNVVYVIKKKMDKDWNSVKFVRYSIMVSVLRPLLSLRT
jgi:hypothetical protein